MGYYSHIQAHVLHLMQYENDFFLFCSVGNSETKMQLDFNVQ